MDLISDFPKKIDNYGLNEISKNNFIQGFRKGIAKSGPLIKESWDLEVQSVELMSEMINHLESSRARWVVKSGQFIFETDADLKKFNSILSQINSCVERQEEIKKQSKNSTMQNFKDLKNKAQQ
jgi:hypothetical protein